MRGRNAVILQSTYFALAAIGMVLRASGAGIQILVRQLAWLTDLTKWAIRRAPPALNSLRRTIRNKWLRKHQKRLDASLFQALTETSDHELQAMAWMIFTQWGRGQSVNQDATENTSDDPKESLRAKTLLRAVERDSTDGDCGRQALQVGIKVMREAERGNHQINVRKAIRQQLGEAD